MQLKRLFTRENNKGMKNYLNSQKKYEVIRTALYFAVSLSLFIAGYAATKTKVNLLTIVAVLGCLPACKSTVEMIMYLRYRSCPEKDAERIETHAQGLETLYDLVFTTYEKNYYIAHAAVRGNTAALYTTDVKMDENACVKHLADSLSMDGIKNVSLKIYKDLDRYAERLDQLHNLAPSGDTSPAGEKSPVLATFKNVSL